MHVYLSVDQQTQTVDQHVLQAVSCTCCIFRPACVAGFDQRVLQAVDQHVLQVVRMVTGEVHDTKKHLYKVQFVV